MPRNYRHTKQVRAIALMVASTVGFSAMHATIRSISADLHPFQIAFFRNFFGLLIFVPILVRTGPGFLRTSQFPLHITRAVLNVLAMLTFFTALSLIPLAKVTAIAFSAPLFAALLAVVVLGERFRVRRWVALVIGFVGTLIILRPGLLAVDLGSILVLASAGLWGVTMIVIKILARRESSLAITGYMSILLSILSLGPALYVWQTPEPTTWLWLLFIGLTGTLAQVALAESLKLGETTVVMPFDFLKLVWATAFGFVLFAEFPDVLTIVGAATIFFSSFYIAYRETKARA